MMPFKRRAFALFALLTLMSGSFGAHAQDNVPEGVTLQVGSAPTNVYVTTQDFLSLRAGPSTGFARIAVVPPAYTLPAYGRSPDTRWIQVEYDGQRGWISARLLVWTGDVINLTVDGIDPQPYIRRATALAITTRETPIYRDFVTPENQVGTIPQGVTVELTGRLGGAADGYLNNFFQLQVQYQGQLFWVGSYNLRPVDGNFLRLLDQAYLYPYGRLFNRLQSNYALALGSYQQIADVWSRISMGAQITCQPIPPRVDREITPEDALREPIFTPAVIALDEAISAINTAVIAFENACASDAPVLRETVDAQLAVIAVANRALILSASLLEPLRVRNPLLNTEGGS
jgi:hypothetical protein